MTERFAAPKIDKSLFVAKNDGLLSLLEKEEDCCLDSSTTDTDRSGLFLVFLSFFSVSSPEGIILNDFHSAPAAAVLLMPMIARLAAAAGSVLEERKTDDETVIAVEASRRFQDRSNKCQHLSYSISSSSSPVVLVVLAAN